MFKMRKDYGKPIFLQDFKIYFDGYQEFLLTTVSSLFLERGKNAHDVSNFLVCTQISSILRIVLKELKICWFYRVVDSCTVRANLKYIWALIWCYQGSSMSRAVRPYFQQWWPFHWLNIHRFHGWGWSKQPLMLCSSYVLVTCGVHSLRTLFLSCELTAWELSMFKEQNMYFVYLCYSKEDVNCL